MAKDIAPALLEVLKEEFNKKLTQNKKIKEIYRSIQEGKATYAEVNELSIQVGDILAEVFQENLSSAILPDGRMYYNIAKRTVEPMMINNYNIVIDSGVIVQELLNQAAGMRIKAQVPPINHSRIDGIIDRLDMEELFDNIKWILDEPVKNFTQAIVDDMVEVNADFHHKLGLKPKIIRKAAPSCCDWCDKLDGEYDYPDVPQDVYRRHRFCRCTVEYDPGGSRRQDVWTKQWR